MPLNANSTSLIRANLQLIASGERAKVVSIGTLTEQQHHAVNGHRKQEGLPPLENPEILFLGRHLYNSRSADGYTIDDMIAQIESGLSAESVVVPTQKLTGLRNPTARADGYGYYVHDVVVLELTARRPKAELFSAIPRGDDIKPPKTTPQSNLQIAPVTDQ